MKTYRQIRQSLTEVGADREEDQNFKLGPDKMSPTPSDEDEYDELDDDIEDTHQEVDAIRPVYVRDKLGYYTHAGGLISSSGTMAQMTQQAATKNLQSEYVPEYGESLDERSLSDAERAAARRRMHDANDGAKKTGHTNSLGHGVTKRNIDAGHHDSDNPNPAPRIGRHQHLIQQARRRRNESDEVTWEEAEESLEENAMDSLKKIVSRQTAETVRLADGSRLKVDMTTANALLGVHGALNVHNQKKMADTLNSNKAGFAKMSKFAFKQFGSRPGKVGTPNTGVQEGSLKLAKKPFDAGDDKIGPNDRTKKREARELARSTGPNDQGGRGRATGSWGDRGRGSTPARGSGNQGATTRPHARDLRNKRTDYSEYTPDHGETLGERVRGPVKKARRAARDAAAAARTGKPAKPNTGGKARWHERNPYEYPEIRQAGEPHGDETGSRQTKRVRGGPTTRTSAGKDVKPKRLAPEGGILRKRANARRGDPAIRSPWAEPDENAGKRVLARAKKELHKRRMQQQSDEYTPDHGETFAEDDANANRIAARAAIQNRANASRKRGGLTSAGHRDMTGRIAAGKHDPKGSKGPKGPKRAGPKYHRAGPKYQWDGRPGELGRPENSEYTPDHGETFAETENVVPGGSYTEAERKAAAKRAKANRAKRAAERKKKSSNDDSDYDKGNYPGYWTDKDEEYQKIKSQIKELASRIKRVDEPIVQEISPGADWADPPKNTAFGTMDPRPSDIRARRKKEAAKSKKKKGKK